MIYLDNSATTPLDPRVLQAMLPWLQDGYGNASSIYELGRSARVAIEHARKVVAESIHAHPAEITFTSGGTESNNAVLRSCLGESHLANTLVVSATEHHAVLAPAEYLHSIGANVHVAPVNAQGRVRPEDLAAYNTPATLISVMHANNETGVIQPLSQIRTTCPNIYLHTDAVQSFGKIPVNVSELGVDFLTMSAHKIHGPKGVGALFIRKGIDFKAHQVGGGQERNRRAGTEPVALIVGFAEAVRLAIEEQERNRSHMQELVNVAREIIVAEIPGVHVNTPDEERLPNILNVSFTDAEQLDGEAILQRMDMMGVAVSNGSACVSGSLQPSHVLLAMGRPAAEAKAAVRISVSRQNTLEEIRSAVTILSDVMRKLRV